MEALLPPLFITLCGACLLWVLLSLRRSLAVLFSRPDHIAAIGTGQQRDALLAEKRAALETLRDLSFEHETGKLSDADFEKLQGEIRMRAKDVLRRLDAELSDYRERARALIAAELGDAPGTPSADDAADAPAEVAAEAPVCGACGTENDADAVFCKKCGVRVAAAEPEAETDTAPQVVATADVDSEDAR